MIDKIDRNTNCQNIRRNGVRNTAQETPGVKLTLKRMNGRWINVKSPILRMPKLDLSILIETTTDRYLLTRKKNLRSYEYRPMTCRDLEPDWQKQYPANNNDQIQKGAERHGDNADAIMITKQSDDVILRSEIDNIVQDHGTKGRTHKPTPRFMEWLRRNNAAADGDEKTPSWDFSECETSDEEYLPSVSLRPGISKRRAKHSMLKDSNESEIKSSHSCKTYIQKAANYKKLNKTISNFKNVNNSQATQLIDLTVSIATTQRSRIKRYVARKRGRGRSRKSLKDTKQCKKQSKCDSVDMTENFLANELLQLPYVDDNSSVSDSSLKQSVYAPEVVTIDGTGDSQMDTMPQLSLFYEELLNPELYINCHSNEPNTHSLLPTITPNEIPRLKISDKILEQDDTDLWNNTDETDQMSPSSSASGLNKDRFYMTVYEELQKKGNDFETVEQKWSYIDQLISKYFSTRCGLKKPA